MDMTCQMTWPPFCNEFAMKRPFTPSMKKSGNVYTFPAPTTPTLHLGPWKEDENEKTSFNIASMILKFLLSKQRFMSQSNCLLTFITHISDALAWSTGHWRPTFCLTNNPWKRMDLTGTSTSLRLSQVFIYEQLLKNLHHWLSVHELEEPLAISLL